MVRGMTALLLAAAVHETQDRADLPARVETWYRVLQGSRPVGYAHEVLRWSPSPRRYEYLRECEVELTLRSRDRHEEEVTVTAFLDDSLTPTDLTLDAIVNDVPGQLWITPAGEERRLEARPAPPKEPATWNVPGRDDLHVLPALTLYALRQNETLSRPGQVTLRAVDPRGEGKESVEVVLEVGKTLQRKVGTVEATGTTVIFRRPFPSGAPETELREAFVDRYGRILEASFAGGARLVFAADRAEAMADLGPVRRHGRRDPMDRLAAMRHADRERRRAQAGEPALEGPLPTVDSLASDLVGVQKLLDEVRARAGEGDLDEAKKGYLQALVRLRAIRELAAKRRPEMLPDIERVRDAAELAWDGAAQTAREARALFVQVGERMDRLDCEGVDGTLQSLLSLRDRIEVERRPERDAISEMASAVGTLAATCRTRRELAQARVQVTGILTGEKTTLESLAGIDGIRFVEAFAWAEINGQVYRAGDVIAGTRIRVDRVTRGSVQVSLRGETRDVGLRR